MIMFYSSGLLCEPVCIVVFYGVIYVVGVACIIGGQGVILNLL